MRVLKFGGTSVGKPEIIRQVVQIVQSKPQPCVVTVSAFGGTTDKLIQTAQQAALRQESYKESLKEIEKRHLDAVNELIHASRRSGVIAKVKEMLNELEDVLQGIYMLRELSARTQDYVMSFGERISAYIVAETFVEYNIEAISVDARQLIRTNADFGNAKVDFKTTNQLIQSFFNDSNKNVLKVVTGFIGSTAQGETTTLGRGGSDYTGAILAAALRADVLEIWTDVDGMLTADPRKVPKALKIEEITYEEAMELSFFGAKVIYPPSIQPAFAEQIPILIKNTFNPNDPGTLITKETKDDHRAIKGVSSINDIALVTLSGGGIVGVPGSAMRMFRALAQQNINIILISQASSEHSISVAISNKHAEEAENALQIEFSQELKQGLINKIVVEKDLAIIAVVGKGMKNTPGISGKIFSALGRNGINVLAIAQGGSEINVSLVINKANEKKALNVIHESFFLSETKSLHVFLVGTGLIGGTLLRQISDQIETLAQRNHIELKVCGIANLQKHIININGIDIKNWQTALEKEGRTTNLEQFINEMILANLPNSVFVDCTASQQVADLYSKILKASISVVTPNKLAASGPYDIYSMLKARAQKHNVKYLFETNVGAGLPIISTLNDLITSGDKIIKIEAILSGSLNFISNTVSKEKKLSQVIREAQKQGYTEPDPRVDLSFKDVARKILILARESGYKMEIEDVACEPFLPQDCFTAPSLEEFFAKVEQYDDAFESMRAQAEKEGKIYRVIATLENGKAFVKFQPIDHKHPFYYAKGSDNFVLFTTVRYSELPLLIKGPGAGAEVTAAGVFADIVRLAGIAN
ncbi:MAG: bifunctional aspartate kinase/homoserine dehydrogenase I [Cytophagales bacterium]|nr:bifunctional aspartate kinase/homoserine dehydrogenase I [Cytophagales bacterium]MDW8383685.1 bifunctional aspartate kinase/homoserine dehydrogenase I [Flammeovirgaceae bacterium]